MGGGGSGAPKRSLTAKTTKKATAGGKSTIQFIIYLRKQYAVSYYSLVALSYIILECMPNGVWGEPGEPLTDEEAKAYL